MIAKILRVLLLVTLTLNLSPVSFAGNYFAKSDMSNGDREISLGYKFKFGPGENNEEKDNLIENLKQENTSGAGTALALVALGACIIVAAILVVNKADDITDRAEDKADEVTATVTETANVNSLVNSYAFSHENSLF